MSGLIKQLVPIPLFGGLAGKDAPLVQAPGTHLQLDNVRQERTGEWRRRHGWARSNLDTLPAVGGRNVLRAVELPGGGALALTEASSDVNTCGRIYSPTTPAARWQVAPQFVPGTTANGTGQASIPVWSRSQLGYVNSPTPFMTVADGNGLRLFAWSGDANPTTPTAMFVTSVEGEIQGNPFAFSASATAWRPRAVYIPATGTFMLLWIEGTFLLAATWSSSGAAVLPATTIATALGATSGLDAMVYPGSTTVSIVFWDNTNKVHLAELNSSLVLSANTPTGVTASRAMQLLPEPDGSGTRFVASSTTNLQQLTRWNSAGTVLSTTTIDTKSHVTIFAGVAVNGGGGAVLVYQTDTGGIYAWKMTTSSTPGTPATLAQDGTSVFIDSNGWREPGTDAMHWMAGVHVGLPNSAYTDFQHNYYEMALEYGGTNVVLNQFTEPQSRLLPLLAGPPTGCDLFGGQPSGGGAPAQVIRVGPGQFLLPLMRVVRFETIGSTSFPSQYAFDLWTVTHLTQSNYLNQNLGQGVKTAQVSYLPSGQLLQTVNGQQVVGHGSGAIPYQPTLTGTTGGALTPSATFGYVVVEEVFDEAGNVWRSSPSTPAKVTLTAGQNAVTVSMTLSPLVPAIRKRTVKGYRTNANGSAYQLDFVRTDYPSNATQITFTDIIADTGLGDLLPTGDPSGTGELGATITPAFSHVALFDGRLWGVERDFPAKVRWSKPIVQGQSPEFPREFSMDLLDELGAISGLATCDDKLMIFKSPVGAYYIAQGGPANDGSGAQYVATHLSSEVGLLVGQPFVSTGTEVYFGSQQGIYRLNKSLEIDYVGLPLDQYLGGQPLVMAGDTLISATYNNAQNEIRFLGLAAQYVFDRVHSIWMRDTFATFGGSAPLGMRTVGGQDVMFQVGGFMWTEGTNANVTDPDAQAFAGIIRTAWIRLAQLGGYLRLYGVRILLDTTSGVGSEAQALTIYRNDQDSGAFVTPTLSPINLARGEYEARIQGQKCGSFSLQLNLANNDLGVRLDGWAAVVGIKQGPRKLTGAARWQ